MCLSHISSFSSKLCKCQCKLNPACVTTIISWIDGILISLFHISPLYKGLFINTRLPEKLFTISGHGYIGMSLLIIFTRCAHITDRGKGRVTRRERVIKVEWRKRQYPANYVIREAFPHSLKVMGDRRATCAIC